MAIAFRSVASTAYASNAGSVAVGKPAGTVDGDIMLAVTATGMASASIVALTPPAGWTELVARTVTVQGGFYVVFHVFWKRAASEGTTYTFTHTPNTQSSELAVLSYSGCIASGSPIDGVSTNVGTNTPSTALSITTTVADAMVIAAGHNWTGAGTAAAFSGGTERFDHLCTACDVLQAVAGATGNKTFANGNSGGADGWQAWLFALKPAVGGGGGGKPAKVWSGSAWVTKPVKVWSGSAWVTKPSKVWNGSAWV